MVGWLLFTWILFAGDVIDTVGGVVSIVNVIDVVAVLPALSIACAVMVCGLNDSVVDGVNDQDVVPLAVTYGLLSIFT